MSEFEQTSHRGQHINALTMSWERMHKYAWFAAMAGHNLGWPKIKYLEEGISLYAQLAPDVMTREEAVQVSLEVTKYLSAVMYSETIGILTTIGCEGRALQPIYHLLKGDDDRDRTAATFRTDEQGYSVVEDRSALDYWLTVVADQLPARQAQVLHMYIEMDQPPFALLGERLGVSAAAASLTLKRAQRNMIKLRQEMKENVEAKEKWEDHSRWVRANGKVRAPATV